MRIHELIVYIVNLRNGCDLVIHNDLGGQTLVLTAVGAVYKNERTNDLKNMTVAFGQLFTSDQWRVATPEEIKKLRETPDDSMMTLHWNMPPITEEQPRPTRLRLVVEEEK